MFDRKNSECFISFLELLFRTYPEKIIHLVLDRASYPRSSMVKDWFEKHPQVHLIYLPPRSPQLNPVEHLWRGLKGKVAANRTYADLEPLKQGCREKLCSLTHKDTLSIAGLSS